jgi:cytochrome bd-type quinol oxidase subunit 2
VRGGSGPGEGVLLRTGRAVVLNSFSTSRRSLDQKLSVVATLFTSLYPRVMVSNPDFGNSLTVSGAASAHYTVAVMTVVALIVTPVVLLYQGWTYYVFRARVTGGEVRTPAEALEGGTGRRGLR